MTRRILALLLIVLPLAIACRTVTYNQEQHTEYWYMTSGTGAALDAGPHRMGTTSTIVGPVLPVNIEDDAGDILGASVSHPIVTTGGGGYVTVDGGTVQTDPIPLAIALNIPVVTNAATSVFTLVDSGPPHYLLRMTVTSAASQTAWWQCYSGQTVPDAGGTNDAGTVPTIEIQCPAQTICGLPTDTAPIYFDGGVCYGSTTQGLLTVDAGAPKFTIPFASLR